MVGPPSAEMRYKFPETSGAKTITPSRFHEPPAQWRVAQNLRRTSRNRDLLQLTVGEEPEILAVGRPERERSAFGSRDPPRIERIERTEPDARLASLTAHKCEIASIGRHLQIAHFARQHKLEAPGHLRRSRLTEVDERDWRKTRRRTASRRSRRPMRGEAARRPADVPPTAAAHLQCLSDASWDLFPGTVATTAQP